MTLKAGAAKMIITPPIGVELAGYSFGPSVGILDDLEAQALVLENGEQAAALVAADLLTVGEELVGRVRRRVEAEIGIPGEAVMLSASHSHSSPTAMPLRQWGRVDEAYLHLLEGSLVRAVRMAKDNARPARLGVGQGCVENISENRRGLQELRDRSVPILRIDDENGVPLAVLFNFACHPVSLHSYRNLISPDYPGYARQVVRKVLGQDVVAMFSLGTAGDINPAGYVPGGTSPARSQQIGEILGCEVAKVALDPQFQEEPVLRACSINIDLPLALLPPAQELEEMFARFAGEAGRLRAEGQPWENVSVQEIQRDWAADALQALERGQAKETLPCEIQAVRLGGAVLLAAPLEIFTQTGLAIKAASPAEATLICSNSNGGAGYLPTLDAYDGNDYTNPRGLAPKVYGIYALSEEAEPLFCREAIRLVQALFD